MIWKIIDIQIDIQGGLRFLAHQRVLTGIAARGRIIVPPKTFKVTSPATGSLCSLGMEWMEWIEWKIVMICHVLWILHSRMFEPSHMLMFRGYSE